jgi:arginyl-tRNA synthetase
MATVSTPADPALQGLDLFEGPLRAALAAQLGADSAAIVLERPRGENLGEFALPCFRFAQSAGKSPAALAAGLAAALRTAGFDAAPAGPFLNVRVPELALAESVLRDARRPDYGRAHEGKVSIVEFSSPNIAKPMHIGHLRSTVIGAALARMLERLGHRVVRINHLGDWGSQFGKLVAAWNRWGSEAALERAPIEHLLELYVRYHADEKSDPTLAAEAKKAFQELESAADNATRATWKRFTALSLREFDKVYRRLGVGFDHLRGESWYEDRLGALIVWLRACGVVEESDGALIVRLEDQGIKTPCLVKTAHETTLYATRDLAAAKSRWEEFHFDHAIYVVGGEQSLHFRQFKAVLARCGAEWQQRIEHVPFGLIRLAEGKLSTREGRVLLLADVLDRAVELARAAIEETNPGHPDKAAAAEQVGIGAVLFHDLKHQRTKDVVFDWKEVLSFEGDTGPYLQYSHARCRSILKKAGRPAPPPDAVAPALVAAEARNLLVALGRFPAALREAAAKREPMVLAHALLTIGAAGNAWYRDHRVLGAGSPALEDARLAVVDALGATLANGLGLLGVPAPEEM